MDVEIVLIVLAGVISLAAAIFAKFNSNRKEKESNEWQRRFEESQKKLLVLYDENKKNTDQIIELQKQLKVRAESQLGELNNLKNPLPQNLNINFEASLVLTDQELKDIKSITSEHYPLRGNMLPINAPRTNEAFEKINAFKNIFFELKVEFRNREKIWTTILQRGPMVFLGYNTTNSFNSFIMTFGKTDTQIKLNGFTLSTSEITSNYASPTLLDFTKADVFVSYKFYYPTQVNVNELSTLSYIGSNQEYLLIQLKSVTLVHKNYRLQIENFRKVNSHLFKASYAVKN